MNAERLESYRTADEDLVVYDSRMPCAYLTSDSAVDLDEMR